jgi:hypothetical protein
MHVSFRSSLSFTLALLLASTPLLQAQQTLAAPPLPPQITSAHTVFVSNAGGPSEFNIFTGGADRAYSSFYSALQNWNHYQFANSPSQADLVFEIRSIAPAVDVYGPHGTDTLVYSPQLILRILDPKTGTVLWTTTANVRAVGRQKTRDRKFDQSVAVLVDKLAQLTGQQLSPAQLKAIKSNSKASTASKVLLAVGIAAVAGTAGFIIYKVANRSSPALPTLPPCLDPPFCPVAPAI